MPYVYILLTIFCLFIPLHTVHAHDGEPAAEQHLMADPPPNWLDERLGEYIPLNTQFIDSNGQKVRLNELIDRPTLIVPVYYRCRNVCNLLLGGLVKALPDIKLEAGKDYRVVTFSIDDEEGTAIAAHSKKTFMTALNNNFPRAAWSFLTGDKKNIRLVTDSAGYRFPKKGADFLHPVAAFVVSDTGKIVRYLNGYRFSPLDLTMALIEASEGRIGNPVRKALSFCFSYDPVGRRYTFNLLRISGTVILLTLGSFLLYLVFGGRKKKS
ncbi:MAG: SCO family protein [Geopsychrobacter sp.]|nr:SCO family protein [Geopsychrobacter sp.]